MTSRLAEALAGFRGGTRGGREMTDCEGDVSQTAEPQEERFAQRNEWKAGSWAAGRGAVGKG